jgi:uncharacterized membrane protein
MQQRYYRIRPPSNPILQVFALIGAAILTIGAIFIGAIFLSLFLGLAVIAGLVLYIRLWWLRRKAGTRASRGRPRPGEYVEVEYTVVQQRSESREKSKDVED